MTRKINKRTFYESNFQYVSPQITAAGKLEALVTNDTINAYFQKLIFLSLQRNLLRLLQKSFFSIF